MSAGRERQVKCVFGVEIGVGGYNHCVKGVAVTRHLSQHDDRIPVMAALMARSNTLKICIPMIRLPQSRTSKDRESPEGRGCDSLGQELFCPRV